MRLRVTQTACSGSSGCTEVRPKRLSKQQSLRKTHVKKQPVKRQLPVKKQLVKRRLPVKRQLLLQADANKQESWPRWQGTGLGLQCTEV